MPLSRHGDWRIGHRLLLLARPYWPHLALLFLLTLLAAPLQLLVPLPLKIAVDSVLGSHPLRGVLASLVPAALAHSKSTLLLAAAGMMIAIALLTQLHALGTWWLQSWVGERLVFDFRARLFAQAQRLSLAYHDSRGVSDSTYRIQYDAVSPQNLAITGTIPLATSALAVVGMIIVLARLDLRLALVAVAVCPVLFVLSHTFGGQVRRRSREVKRLDSSTMSMVHEALAAARVVKSFGREEHEHRRFLHRAGERFRGQLGIAAQQGWFDLLVGLTISAGGAAVLLVGTQDVLAGRLTLGGLLVGVTYLGQIYPSLRTLSKKITDIQSGLASAERAFQLLDETPEVTERQNPRPLKRAKGRVEFRDVSFAFDGAHPVLRNVSFVAEPGTWLGIQGRTGAGKTTLVSLLNRFYDPSAGAILLDGIDLREYKLADLRNQFGIVLQDTVLFATTLAENIAYGRPDATHEEIVAAASDAAIHEFITSLPDGYESQVGERGMKLSGGERQRIALARAFLKDAPILILDEPTSAVDAETEAVVLRALDRLMRGRTTFMVTHHTELFEWCDARLELEHGRVVPEVEPSLGAQ
ncbi:MAG TPA: ABC transporter ATP-binding protein [Candidatus Eisenbacteria bacterium]|jgi:ATP-binding cassette subfamily B protein